MLTLKQALEFSAVFILSYSLLLFACVPFLKPWQWFYKYFFPQIKNNRTAAIWSVLLISPAIWIMLAIGYGTYRTHLLKSDFDQAQWLLNKNVRYKMSAGVIKKRMLIGKTKPEVQRMLGKAFQKTQSDEWTYPIGYPHVFFEVDPYVLTVTFKNGVAVEVAQYES